LELIDFTVPLAKRGYEVVGRDRGVTTYRRRGASFIDLAADGRMPVAPAHVQAALIDYGRHVAFLKNVAESRVLWRGRNRLLVYQRLDLPLVSDRDYTLAVSWGRRGGLLFVSFECANHRGPAVRSGLVRVSTHSGGWLLKPAPGASTLARYQVLMNLGGSLPRFLARSGAGREIPSLFASITKQARQRAKAR
jgi:hypothetical protein